MATRRHRSSTAASRRSEIDSPAAIEIKSLIDRLVEPLGNDRWKGPSLDTLQIQCIDLWKIRQLLQDSSAAGSEAKSAFRHGQGFDAVLKTLESVHGYYRPSHISPGERDEFFELLKISLYVLSAAQSNHPGNRRFFTRRVRGGGWAALEKSIFETGIKDSLTASSGYDVGLEQYFGCLLAFATGEESMASTFRDIRKVASSGRSDEIHEGESPEESSMIRQLKDRIDKHCDGSESLQNPECIPILFQSWAMTLEVKPPDPDMLPLSVTLLLLVRRLLTSSASNKLAFHQSKSLEVLLPILFEEDLNDLELSCLRGIVEDLCTYGVSSLSDAYYLYKQSTQNETAAEVLASGIKSSRQPAFIQFDLSKHGFSSVELANLERPFPPTSGGYTLTAWIKIDNFDTRCHTTLFGAYDATQTCFVLAYLEKESRHFILQTSVNSPKPSVRFRSVVFEEGRWYHLAVVHRRPKPGGSSIAALFVNGEFSEQAKCYYPSPPPPLSEASESFVAIASSGPKRAPVQAFIGTPRNLTSKQGRNVLSLRWSLASLHLFEDALSDELVAVYQKLGPRYHGNFQDCLGSFQTYRASAELNLYNELLHPGREEKSQIVTAIRMRASNVLPESKILLSISPISVMDDDDSNNIDESQLVKSLSKGAARSLQSYTVSGGNVIAINAAIPSINEALLNQRGVALLAGDPNVVVPQSLDDASWRIAGCAAVGLKLVQLAQSPEAVLGAVRILFDSVDENWRNSEAMERDNGFGVLAGLIREKLGLGKLSTAMPVTRTNSLGLVASNRVDFTMQLLQAVLGFVGYNRQSPEDSIIINPLAYRILLVDFDMWRKSAAEAQVLYYRQLVHFAKDSKHHHFNSKRLNRMRIVKKLLDALKGENFLFDVFPTFLQTFEVLIRCNMSGEVLRSLALFITFALHDSRASYTRPSRAKSNAASIRDKVPTPNLHPGTPASSRSTSPAQDQRTGGALSLGDIGAKILKMYADIMCDQTTHHDLRKFAKTVTNKWLLYLLAENDVRVIVPGAKILSRLLVLHGSGYIKKFADKSGGFTITKHRLKNWWNTPALWTICFAILFGMDVAQIDFERDFDLYNLIDAFAEPKGAVAHPEAFPVITAMLGTAVRAVLKSSEEDGEDPISPSRSGDSRSRSRSMSLETELAKASRGRPNIGESVAILNTVIQFLLDLQSRCAAFREFTVSSVYLEELLSVLYPVVVSSDIVSAETELHSRGSALTFEGQDVVIRPHSRSDSSIIRTTTSTERPSSLKRGSSFVLLNSEGKFSPSAARFNPVMSPKKKAAVKLGVGNILVQGLVEIVVGVFQDQIFQRKDFSGFGLFLKVPPGFQEHQAYFETYILRHAMSSLRNALQLDQKLLLEPKVITNLSRYSLHMSEAVFEGWFLNGTEPLLDFLGTLLDYLQQPDIAKIKSVRLCATPISTIRSTFNKVLLLRFSELNDDGDKDEIISFMGKMAYWQTIIFSPQNSEEYNFSLICYMLYLRLIDERQEVRQSATDFWRTLIVQKPVQVSNLLSHTVSPNHRYISTGFMKLTEMDNEPFLQWLNQHRTDVDALFFGVVAKTWEDFVSKENQKTQDTAKNRVAKRRDKLAIWKAEEAESEDVLHRHEISTAHWRANIHASERLKHQRASQDQQDNLNFIASSMEALDLILKGPCGLFEEEATGQWQLDATEGRNRMRMRLVRCKIKRQVVYQPKRSQSMPIPRTKITAMTSKDVVGASPSTLGAAADEQPMAMDNGQTEDPEDAAEDGFEMVEDPKEEDEGFEDKNRKVMRSLQHGDQVQHVCNVSRIIGLEFCEGLFILGKTFLYLLDNFFQRSDGEIVRVWQAPPEERDSYLKFISGRKKEDLKPQTTDSGGDQTRHWRWEEVLSVSKRRFLLRDVALEVFFTDGRSYLLTVTTSEVRNDLYSKLLARAPQLTNSSSSLQPDDVWRLESLRTPEDVPQTLGHKFANVFNTQAFSPGTKKWLRGEISNFQYLMLVNTMAGRTFNDLTQYPVFPWVLADYTSNELDLNDPKSFRDFTKPMGAQNAKREQEFRERYQTIAEMSDSSTEAFHYGTHYSNAMVVSGFLIRLQPFVQSFILLQGGGFDYADRMFFSIGHAWASSSGGTNADVRELTPEFFYLPEFLTNINGYDMGQRKSNNKGIDSVELPPWAHGDPNIFIRKHREALESPYVSKHLHHWIDLIFGYKQNGEAAIAATNVFHHLSYHGAIDLDNITDADELGRTVGIIHNFGQTPIQVFQKPHPQQEALTTKPVRLDIAVDSLIRLPEPRLDMHDRVASLLWSARQSRLLCSAAFRLNIPPNYDRHMEWGFADGSVRFYSSDNTPIGLFEHMHQGQISCATFVDSKLLITAGTDCTVSAWTVAGTSRFVELQPKFTVFGHRAQVTVLATSRALGVFLSASKDGKVFLWDLNRSVFIREVVGGDGAVQCAKINDVTGRIMLCYERVVRMLTLNGHLLLEQDLGAAEADACITACAFYEGVSNEWVEKELVFIGQKRGIVDVWSFKPWDSPPGSPSSSSSPPTTSASKGANGKIDRGKWYLQYLKRLNHGDPAREDGRNYQAAITCILPLANRVFTGDEDGLVHQWDVGVVQRGAAGNEGSGSGV